MNTETEDSVVNWRYIAKTNIFYARMTVLAYLAMCAAMGVCGDVLLNVFYWKMDWRTAIEVFVYFKQYAYICYGATLLGFLVIVGLYFFHRSILLAGLETTNMTETQQADYKMLLENLAKMSKQIGLAKTPDLVIADSQILNTFVGGSNDKNNFVVLTSGLLDALTTHELQAVLLSQLCHLKLADQRLTLAVALCGNIPLLCFDLCYHRFIWGPDRDPEPNPILALFFKGLIIARFLIPAGTFLFRFILSSERFYNAQKMTVKLMNSNEPLAKALIKIYESQLNDIDKYGQLYSEIPYDEMRREVYLFDPADINNAQTFASPFTTHPSLEEQLAEIAYGDYHPNYQTKSNEDDNENS